MESYTPSISSEMSGTDFRFDVSQHLSKVKNSMYLVVSDVNTTSQKLKETIVKVRQNNLSYDQDLTFNIY